ncbi:MAG: hypothetical protein V1806_08550 [Pseudomonadota bacterium]
MNRKMQWKVSLGVLAVAFALTLTREPAAISRMLATVAADMNMLSFFMHGAFLAALAAGLLLPAARVRWFGGFMALLAASAASVALGYFILPNILVFGLYLALILQGLWRGELGWDLAKTSAADRLFGILGLGFGFWYLHWVQSPIMLNALLYSPLGVVNCPTMLSISGLLCLANRRPAGLELVSGVVCTYFGLFGIILLGAYVDVALVVCGTYQLARLAITARRGARPELGRLEKA